jgi:hypothetical protein
LFHFPMSIIFARADAAAAAAAVVRPHFHFHITVTMHTPFHNSAFIFQQANKRICLKRIYLLASSETQECEKEAWPSPFSFYERMKVILLPIDDDDDDGDDHPHHPHPPQCCFCYFYFASDSS